jgi:uncharacterized protein related to proFAR isomerase
LERLAQDREAHWQALWSRIAPARGSKNAEAIFYLFGDPENEMIVPTSDGIRCYAEVLHGKLAEIADAAGPERLIIALDSKAGKVVTHGWREAINFSAEEVIQHLEPYCSGFLCTYVDKEGMLEGTDLDWFRRLRAATRHELTAAGGITSIEEIQELHKLGIHAALGMAIYTGRLNLEELALLNP